MKQRRGYILLTVLLLLMLAAVVMAGFCRSAIQRSLAATAATDELQRRWGTLTCRDSLLPNAENILETLESSTNPINQMHMDFVLGRESFAVDICDEQAKANVNALYALKGKARAEQSIEELAKVGGSPLKPRLRLSIQTDLTPKSAPPTQAPSGDAPAESSSTDIFPVAFGSWREIFPDAQYSDLSPNVSTAVARNLTCWGNGSLNLRRASVASITQMCSPILSPQQIAQLVLLRSRLGESAAVDQILASAHVATNDATNLSSRLTLTSAAQSMWITATDHSQTQHRLFIRDSSNSDDVRSFAFQW